MAQSTKSIRDFIKENKVELQQTINKRLNKPENEKQTNEDCRLWILNDEPLYNWARSEGVNI